MLYDEYTENVHVLHIHLRLPPHGMNPHHAVQVRQREHDHCAPSQEVWLPLPFRWQAL